MEFLTKILTDAAKEYVGRRGIDGVIEDAGKVAKGVGNLSQKFFGSDDSSDELGYDENAFGKETWDELCSKVDEAKDAGDYDAAINILNSYYKSYQVERDYWYNYVKADILLAQYTNCLDRPQNKDLALKIGIENVIQSCKGRYDEDKESTQELVERFNNAQGLVKYRRALMALNEDIQKLRDPKHVVTTSKVNDALKALDMLSDFFSDNPKMKDGTVLDIDMYYFWRAGIFNAMFFALTQNRNELNSLSDKQLSDFFEDAIDSAQKALGSSELDDKSDEEFYCQRIPEQIEEIKQLRNGKSITSSSSSSEEQEYLEEVKACLEDDGKITDKERRLLDRLRKSLGISEERAKELEASLSGLSDEEKEYQEELKACMEDGHISDRERRLLDRLRKSLGISEQRAKEIENSL